MIRSFNHKALERFFKNGTPQGIPSQQLNRIRIILGRSHVSTIPSDMDLPGLHLHELKGQRRGTWSVRVTSNWRITFRFQGNDAHSVNLEDYH
jgi:proteic killer suppression protein